MLTIPAPAARRGGAPERKSVVASSETPPVEPDRDNNNKLGNGGRNTVVVHPGFLDHPKEAPDSVAAGTDRLGRPEEREEKSPIGVQYMATSVSNAGAPMRTPQQAGAVPRVQNHCSRPGRQGSLQQLLFNEKLSSMGSESEAPSSQYRPRPNNQPKRWLGEQRIADAGSLVPASFIRGGDAWGHLQTEPEPWQAGSVQNRAAAEGWPSVAGRSGTSFQVKRASAYGPRSPDDLFGMILVTSERASSVSSLTSFDSGCDSSPL